VVAQSKGAESIREVRGGDPTMATSFPTNKISNTKYTIYNFLFLNLYEQFSYV